MENALVRIDELNPAVIFSASEEVDAILQEVEHAAWDGFGPGLTTAAGRKRIASQAHKVARSKTLLDDAGKNLVANLKAKVKTVDVERKRLRDGLDDLKASIRRPLTEWEEAEAARIAPEKLAAEIDAANAQAEEAERRRWEAAERERIRKEEEARREAEEDARIKREEAERIDRESKELIAKLKADAEEKKASERKRQEEEARQIADQEHRAKVEGGIKAAFIDLGCYPDTAEATIDAVRDGKIPGLQIQY